MRLLRQADRGSFILSFLVTNLPVKEEAGERGCCLMLPDSTLPLRLATLNISGSRLSTGLARPRDLAQ